MKISELMLLLKEDESVSFRMIDDNFLIKIEKYNLGTKKVWTIGNEFSNDFLTTTVNVENIISDEFQHMLKDLRDANK